MCHYFLEKICTQKKTMCHQTKCCGCIPLRTGCLIIAILSTVFSFTWFFLNAFEYKYSVPLCLIGLAAGVCLLIGVILNNKTLVLVGAILDMIGLVSTLLVAVIFLVMAGVFASTVATTAVAPLETTFIAIFLTMVLIGVILDIYFLVVVWSFYKELKSGRRENIC